MIVTILGAGHGGQAMAADLALAGHTVRLAAVPEHSTNIKLLSIFGGIVAEGVTSSGAKPGFAKLDMITTDVPGAVKGAEVIMIVIPAFGQDVYMDIIIEHGEKGQIIVFNPGKFASLLFAHKLMLSGRKQDFLFGETNCLLYAAKTKGIGHINIKAVKNQLPFSAFPSKKTAEVIWTLLDLFPQLSPSFNVLETSINDPGMVIHPVTTLMNMSRIEQMGPYRTSYYDITPSVGRILEAVDKERMEVAKVLCFESFTFIEFAELMYKVKGASVYESELQITAHKTQMAPESLFHRYVTEDIPYGLVTLANFGDLLKINTPAIDSIINIASIANQANYWEMGRNLSNLGLSGLSKEGIIKYVTDWN